MSTFPRLACGLAAALTVALSTAAPVLAAGVVDRAGAEHRINATYKQLMGKLDADARRKLQAAELAWIRYKDLDVAFHRSWLGASAAEERYVTMTNDRTGYLTMSYHIVGRIGTGIDMFISDRPYAAADKALNTAYGKLVPQLDATSRKQLLAAQLAWIKFRDAEAAFWKTWSRFSYSKEDMTQTCLATLTDLRTEEFKQLTH